MDNSQRITITDILGSDNDWEILGSYSGIKLDSTFVMAAHEDHGAGFFGFKNIEEMEHLFLEILLCQDIDEVSEKKLF